MSSNLPAAKSSCATSADSDLDLQFDGMKLVLGRELAHQTHALIDGFAPGRDSLLFSRGLINPRFLEVYDFSSFYGL